MSNESQALPNINPSRKKSTQSITKSPNHKTNLNDNDTSDCDSIISYKEERNQENKVFFDKLYKTKNNDSKSILSIAKDLNENIQVKLL